jgi:hypothetical protein
MSNKIEFIKDETLTPKKQRVVNKKLGKNITKNHNEMYDEIEKRFGETKNVLLDTKGEAILA